MIDLSDRYVPHAKQRAIHESQAKDKVLEMARRFGKSRTALWELIATYIEALNSPAPHSLTPPFHAWIVGPAFPQTEQVWTELMEFIPYDWMLRPPNQEHKRIDLKGDANGNRGWGLIEVKSAHDPENLQTAGLDFLWVTEAQDIQNKAFEKMRPMLRSPDRMGRAVWEGIPSLYNQHWFWKLCDYAQTERAQERGYAYFHGTAFENPMLTPEQMEEIEDDRNVYTDAAWRRVYLAERSESAGFFKNIDTCTSGDLLMGPLPGFRYVAGLDLGRKHDASVLWIMDAQERKGVYHMRWDAGEDWSYQRESIVAACREWEVATLRVDATGMGGDIFSQSLAEAQLPVEEVIFNENNRLELLNAFAIAMERSTVTFPYDENLQRELRAFQWVKRGNGKPRPDHPDGEHDDEIFALAMALQACEQGVPESARRFAQKSGRYLPTQAEAAGGVANGFGARLMARNRQERMERRWERTGVIL